jgi:tRNA (guanine-N7-)-methyltransferase
MSRKKQKRFNELKSFPNVLERNMENFKEEVGKIFNEYDNIILELGCGKGEYSIHLAKRYPEYLVIGIDIQGERIWRGAKNAQEEKLDNVFFLRMQIENICSVIPKGSVNEIWITFPDPFPRDRDSKKRLPSPRFIKLYKKILKKGGLIHLKTDSDDLYEYTKESIKEEGFKIEDNVEDIYYKNRNINSDLLLIQTTFEKKHLEDGKSIKYLRVSL